MLPKSKYWMTFLLALLLAGLYGSSFNHFFLSDDFTWLAKAKNHSLRFLGMQGFESSGIFRPFFYLYVQVNFSFFGVSTRGWNALQLLLHFGNCLLLALIVTKVVKVDWIGFLAAVTYALHFINVEAVFWLSAASYTLATFFILLTLYLFVQFKEGGKKLLYFASFVSALLALFSNEQATSLFLILIVFEFRYPAVRSAHFRSLLPYFLVVGLFTGFRLFAFDFHFPDGVYHPATGLNFLKNYLFLMVGSLFRLDFMALLDPWQNLQSNGNFSQLIADLGDTPASFIILILSPLLYFTVFFVYRNTRAFILWSFCALLPVAFFAGTGERLLYLPLTGFAAIIPICIHKLSEKMGGKTLIYSLAIVWLGYLILQQRSTLKNWLTASDITRKTVSTIGRAAHKSARPITICADWPPDNYRGAWVFRMGFEQLGELFYPAGSVETKIRSASECLPDSNRQLFRGEYKNYELFLKPTTQK